jgi:ABC-type transport system involved in multi-copper enzyme maturation permease subunit
MTTALTPLRDFPDFLSPMVVKELRQGLRTRAFSSTMLLMHVLLILITLMTGFAENSLDMHWMLDGMATLVLCLIMPFRVFNALSEEVKMNTLDMLMLTRITCTRIVFGKWASVALQSLLITFSLMPYIVARYVFGGMDLVMELNFLGMKWLIGIVIAALLVMLSTIRQAWLKNLIIVVPLFFSFFGVVNLMFSSITGSSMISFSGPDNMWLYVAGTLLSALWFIYAFLSLAASRISPPAAPLAWQKRTVHVLTILLLLGISLFTREDGWVAAAMAVLAFLTLDVMTEPLNEIPSAYVPFYKRGALSRPLLLLCPGWASGFLLTFIMASLVGLCFYLVVSAADLPYYVLACCTVWMVTSLIQIFPFTRRAEDLLPIFLGTFVLVYLLIGMFSGIGVMAAKATGEQPWFLVAIPPAAMIGADQMTAGAEREKFIWVSMLCGAAWPAIMALISANAWRKLFPVHRAARSLSA